MAIPPPTTIFNTDNRPWLALDHEGQNSMKILSLDEERRELILLVKFAPHAMYPSHLHKSTAIVWTLEGEWSYEEGTIRPGTLAIERDGVVHTPEISAQGATVLAILTSETDSFVEIPMEDGTVLIQDLAYWKRLYDLTPEEAKDVNKIHQVQMKSRVPKASAA